MTQSVFVCEYMCEYVCVCVCVCVYVELHISYQIFLHCMESATYCVEMWYGT